MLLNVLSTSSQTNLRDKAVWICTLVLAAAFSVPHCVQFTHLRTLLYEAGHAGLCRRIQYARTQASGTDLSPEQQNDAELARYANAALAAQTDAAFLDSAESDPHQW